MISVEKLHQLCLNKKVFIWGAMIVGQGVCRSLERNGMPVEAFIDKSLSLHGRKALSYPIRRPDSVFACVRDGNGIIIIGSGHNSPEIAVLCAQEGFAEGKDYILCESLNDIDPSVDVAGMCNLKCISCPRGNEKQQPPVGFMTALTYKKVLDKLIREIPLLGSIQLYTWGEPLLNPELPAIVAITREAQVLSAISSNLNYAKNLDAVVAARPDWFKISCSGWAENYERTHTGGKWKVFLSNLQKLAHLRDILHPDMQIILNYHLYKHNTGEDYNRIEALCKDLSLIFIPNHAYLYPLDSVMDFVDGKELSPEAKKTLPMLLMTLEEGIAQARKRSALPCPEERCFPINWDCRVRECGVFFRPFVAENFLDTPLSEIIRRKKSGLCVECRKRAIHQFTSVYLAEKRLDHPEANQ
jgi:MoaA/NifB/PqqE/SkfB family radical SAM enzyme